MNYPELVAASLILAWSAIGIFAWAARRRARPRPAVRPCRCWIRAGWDA